MKNANLPIFQTLLKSQVMVQSWMKPQGLAKFNFDMSLFLATLPRQPAAWCHLATLKVVNFGLEHLFDIRNSCPIGVLLSGQVLLISMGLSCFRAKLYRYTIGLTLTLPQVCVSLSHHLVSQTREDLCDIDRGMMTWTRWGRPRPWWWWW